MFLLQSFQCYSEEIFTEFTGESFAAAVLDNRYKDNDFVFAAFPAAALDSFMKYVVPYLEGCNIENCIVSDTDIGTIVKYALPVIENPAYSIAIEPAQLEIGISERKTVKAILPEGSDDRVVWYAVLEGEDGSSDAGRFISISAGGTEAVITGRRNGTVVLTALVYSSLNSENKISAECSF